MFRHVSRTPALPNEPQGLPQELRELFWRWPVIPVKNPGCSGRGRSGMQLSIEEDGRWASDEGVQNRIAVTGRRTVCRRASELQRATDSYKQRQNRDFRLAAEDVR
jgi:hypothetical protein